MILNSKYLLSILTVFVLSGCSSQLSSFEKKSFSEGKQAFHAQEYETTFTSLMPLAEKGDPESQYAIGYLYYHGKGVQQDLAVAKLWFRAAAKQGHSAALKALNILNNQDSAYASLSHSAQNITPKVLEVNETIAPSEEEEEE